MRVLPQPHSGPPTFSPFRCGVDGQTHEIRPCGHWQFLNKSCGRCGVMPGSGRRREHPRRPHIHRTLVPHPAVHEKKSGSTAGYPATKPSHGIAQGLGKAVQEAHSGISHSRPLVALRDARRSSSPIPFRPPGSGEDSLAFRFELDVTAVHVSAEVAPTPSSFGSAQRMLNSRGDSGPYRAFRPPAQPRHPSRFSISADASGTVAASARFFRLQESRRSFTSG
jgi:hypothetical protein